jgi:predicted O-linked N-acetylglucosamine transferase (SPINDLY family)
MTYATLEQALEAAVAEHQAGRLAEAEALYRAVLARAPGHADALHLLGVVAAQTGRYPLAIELVGGAIAASPDVASYHNSLGESYRLAGRRDLARASLGRALALDPGYGDAYNNLGSVLREEGDFEGALTAHRQAVALSPASAEAQVNLALASEAAGRLDEAIAAYRRAVALRPGQADLEISLGNALRLAGDLDGAIAAYSRAITHRPDAAGAHNRLGAALYESGRLGEAIAAYRRAIALEPDFADALNNLGAALVDADRLDEAVNLYRRALSIRPEFAEAHNNLGNALKTQGRIDEALASFRRALEIRSDLVSVASNVLHTLHFHPDCDAQVLLAEHRRWAERYAAPLVGAIAPHTNDRTPGRRLRIGLVSPDFRHHAVGHLALPFFRRHDRARIELVAYSNSYIDDAATAQLKALADGWRDTAGLDDAALADLVRRDRIDILIDLSSHTAGHRLLVFARKPAPVLVTMLGMPSTTGLATIEFRLTDAYLDPPGRTDGDYSERSILVEPSIWCYEPPARAPEVGPPPALKNGYVTFGCLNQFAKASPPALEAWTAILTAVAGARLVLLAPEGSHREALLRRFEGRGVARERVAFVAKSGWLEYLGRYLEIDVGIDPFPYNGHTTTLDALWMGVPVVTQSGRTGVGRGGVSILSNLGLPELIAASVADYVARAVAWACDLDRLAALRAGLRGRMEASPLRDEAGYAAAVEAALRRCWEAWCRG